MCVPLAYKQRLPTLSTPPLHQGKPHNEFNLSIAAAAGTLYLGASFFFFQAEDGIRDFCLSRGLGDVYKRQDYWGI